MGAVDASGAAHNKLESSTVEYSHMSTEGVVGCEGVAGCEGAVGRVKVWRGMKVWQVVKSSTVDVNKN